jgi:hypothetical protein
MGKAGAQKLTLPDNPVSFTDFGWDMEWYIQTNQSDFIFFDGGLWKMQQKALQG